MDTFDYPRNGTELRRSKRVDRLATVADADEQ